MITVSLTQSIDATADDVFAALLAHEQLSRFFDATFNIKQSATDEHNANGAGLIREVTMRGESFSEEIVAAKDGYIHYRIIGNKPVENHYGGIRVTNNSIGCVVNYVITCSALWWQPSFIVKRIITNDISQGLTKLAEHFNGRNINSTGD